MIALGISVMPSSAYAQNVAPFGFTIVVVGIPIYINMGGAGVWHGISEDGVDGARFGNWFTGLGYGDGAKASLIPRQKVEYVCPENCRKMSFGDPPKEDTVYWKDGKKTTGRIEVKCHDYNFFFVFQDGKPSHKDATYAGDWPMVDYIYLAPLPKP